MSEPSVNNFDRQKIGQQSFSNKSIALDGKPPKNLCYLPCQSPDKDGMIWADIKDRKRHPIDVLREITTA